MFREMRRKKQTLSFIVQKRDINQKSSKRMQKYPFVQLTALKYAPEDTADGRKRAIDREWRTLCVLEMTISHMIGKEAIELINAREQKRDE